MKFLLQTGHVFKPNFINLVSVRFRYWQCSRAMDKFYCSGLWQYSMGVPIYGIDVYNYLEFTLRIGLGQIDSSGPK